MNTETIQSVAGVDMNALFAAMIQRGLMYAHYGYWPAVTLPFPEIPGRLSQEQEQPSFTFIFSEKQYQSDMGTTVHVTKTATKPHVTLHLSFVEGKRYYRTHVEDHIVAAQIDGSPNFQAIMQVLCERLDINMTHHPSQFPPVLTNEQNEA